MDKFHPQSEGLLIKEGHEESDLSVRGIIIFAIFLVIGGIVANVGVLAMLYGFESWHKSHDAKLTPVENQLRVEREVLQETQMRTPLPPGEATGVKPPPDYYGREAMEDHLARTFPQPRLQYNDNYDMGIFRTSEEDWLNGTGRDAAGTVHIPVDRAMDLLVKGGLPQVSGPYLQPNNLPTAVPMVPAGPSRPLNK